MKMNLELTSASRFLILAFGLVLSANKPGKLRSLITKRNTLGSTGLIHSATMAPRKLKNLSFVNIHYNNLNINSSLISMFSRGCGAAPQ